jgi:hypothetical protein
VKTKNAKPGLRESELSGKSESKKNELATAELVNAVSEGKEGVGTDGNEVWVPPARRDCDLLSLLEAS